MLDALIVLIFVAAGAVVGYTGGELLPQSWLAADKAGNAAWILLMLGTVLGLGMGLAIRGALRRLEEQIRQMPTDSLIARSAGLVVGLLVANLLLGPVFLLPFPSQLDFVKWLASLLASVLFGYLGMTLSESHGQELLRRFNISPRPTEDPLLPLVAARSKILDTNTIIDGRVEELLQTGFLEGTIVIPCFVLAELQYLADSADNEKRTKGRRGLDILNQLQPKFPNRLLVHDLDYPKLSTVDAKLIRLAQDLEAALVTNDFNLNKVASLQGVAVLNVNELANVLKPRYRPGDWLEVRVLREGKENRQGVAYLEDGTMIVVEDGRDYIGEHVAVTVTSSLQTAAGRMIFARPQQPTVAS
ncbi:PIN/TRAM domain-containing protein [Candidatus Cyanaurora vandensis]|uniref:PIN/TRAM domain-containing protein n=1 Tax=Candidatus Cyanaurora vandensis TaxID=2714958 RepID=UPI00257F0788|nr:PIN/TRAM domain-containing protein [Candidatus Cyanaurora vandensis]